MFKAALRSVRPATRSLRPVGACSTSLRALSINARCLSDHPSAPALYGPGAKAGAVPTDEEQATGLERFQLLAEAEGLDAFDYEPLDSSRVGTLADPIKVYSLDTERIIGCTGCPADSHDVLWFTVSTKKTRRCPECGSAYAIDFHGDPHAAQHH